MYYDHKKLFSSGPSENGFARDITTNRSEKQEKLSIKT